MSEELKRAADLLLAAGWTVAPPGPERWGCHCELFAMPDDFQPDGCVIDEGDRRSCIYALGIERKEQCQYWLRVTPESVRKARGR